MTKLVLLFLLSTGCVFFAIWFNDKAYDVCHKFSKGRAWPMWVGGTISVMTAPAIYAFGFWLIYGSVRW